MLQTMRQHSSPRASIPTRRQRNGVSRSLQWRAATWCSVTGKHHNPPSRKSIIRLAVGGLRRLPVKFDLTPNAAKQPFTRFIGPGRGQLLTQIEHGRGVGIVPIRRLRVLQHASAYAHCLCSRRCQLCGFAQGRNVDALASIACLATSAARARLVSAFHRKNIQARQPAICEPFYETRLICTSRVFVECKDPRGGSGFPSPNPHHRGAIFSPPRSQRLYPNGRTVVPAWLTVLRTRFRGRGRSFSASTQDALRTQYVLCELHPSMIHLDTDGRPGKNG